MDQAVGAYEIDVRGNDLWLLNGERAVAVFEGLVDQHDFLEGLIWLSRAIKALLRLTVEVLQEWDRECGGVSSAARL